MNSLRIARAALRARPAAVRAPLQRRGYAEAVSDKVRRGPPRVARSVAANCRQLTTWPPDQAQLVAAPPGTLLPEHISLQTMMPPWPARRDTITDRAQQMRAVAPS
jgi:hypothetical protein